MTYQPHQIALKEIASVLDSPDVHRGDTAAFEQLSLHVQSLVGLLKTLGTQGDMELRCGSHVVRMLSKLSPEQPPSRNQGLSPTCSILPSGYSMNPGVRISTSRHHPRGLERSKHAGQRVVREDGPSLSFTDLRTPKRTMHQQQAPRGRRGESSLTALSVRTENTSSVNVQQLQSYPKNN